jgi:large subunit ribosomal protein L41
LTPFVDARLEKVQYTNDPNKAENYAKRLTGEDYLRAWKLAGGNDEVDAGVVESRRNMPVPFEERPASKVAKS